MPPACPSGMVYVPCYADSIKAAWNATGLSGGSLRSFATTNSIKAALNATGLPGGSLRSLLHQTASQAAWNATGLPGGSLRSLLHRDSIASRLECHRLARWIVTFLATPDIMQAAWNATGLPGGSLRSLLHETASQAALNATGLPSGSLRSLLHGQHRSRLECHRLARWIVTFLATVAENVKYPPGKPRAFTSTAPIVQTDSACRDARDIAYSRGIVIHAKPIW